MIINNDARVCPGVCYTVPLVGGRIADLAAGRFNTIFASFLFLLVGNCVCIHRLPLMLRRKLASLKQ